MAESLPSRARSFIYGAGVGEVGALQLADVVHRATFGVGVDMHGVFDDGFLKRSTDIGVVGVAVESVGGVVVARVRAIARVKGLEFLRGDAV